MHNEKLNVLIIDDSEFIVERVKFLLNEIDSINIVLHAKNGHDALALIDGTKPQVVLLDIQMGDESGVDLLVKIRMLYADIKVIMLSNFSNSYYRKICKEKGADYFFDKSTEFEKIPELMKQIAI